MSHYTVLVINTKGEDDVDEQLEPFDESIEMDEYSKGPVSKEDLIRFKNCYTDPNDHIVKISDEEKKANENLSLEELYEKYGNDWNSNQWRLNNGVWEETSTYNPKSKWDWYSIGGRWIGMLLTKNDSGVKGVSGAFGNGPRHEAGVDQACKGDIDWKAMTNEEDYKKAIRYWEMVVEGSEPVTEKEKEDVKFSFYKPEYYTNKFGTKENYAKYQTSFHTYAVLKDGEWVEPGQMGWFGMSSADPKDEFEFGMNFMKDIVDPLPDEALLTVVDCHI